MRIRGLAIALAVSAGSAMAQPATRPAITGEDFQAGTTGALAKLCAAGGTDAVGAAAATYCHGFLSGVGQFHRGISQSGGAIAPLFCAPQPPPTIEQVASGFASWAQANPQYAAEPAVDGLVRFAQTRFPCPTQPAATPRTRGR
jgi:hypothetical protein